MLSMVNAVNKQETRRYWSSKDIEWIRNKDASKNLTAIAMVENERTSGEETSREKRYYISALAGEARPDQRSNTGAMVYREQLQNS